VLAIAGAIVVQEGGLLSHAAVMARELGIPAVIGCRGAMTLVGDGDLVEIDADRGEVRVVERRQSAPSPAGAVS
jgi:phosphohistidine swiveling domain-containing protein